MSVWRKLTCVGVIFLFFASGGLAADRVGDLIIFISDAEDDYPHAGKFNHIVDKDNFYGKTYDAFQFQDWEGNYYKAVNDGGDSDDWEITKNRAPACHLSIFDHDHATSETAKAVFNEGTHIHYGGKWPGFNDWEMNHFWYDDGNQPWGEKNARTLYKKLRDKGFNGHQIDGADNNNEMIRGPNSWKMHGDILCADHTGGDDLEWKMCTDSEDNGDQVTINGNDYVCDASANDWFVNNQPNARFDIDQAVDDGQYSVGEDLTFDPSNSGPGADSSEHDSLTTYRWDWDNDGNWEDEVGYYPVTHSFSTEGQKTITLQVEDRYAKTDTTTQTIVVEDNCLYGDNAGTGSTEFTSKYIDYGDDVRFDISHNDAGRCPSESEAEFNVCDHELGEEYIQKTSDKYIIDFDIPEDVACSWGYSGPGEGEPAHKFNFTRDDGTNIPHDELYMKVSSKGDIADPHSGYYIYIEQSVQHDPSNLSGMWLSNQTWYDCDGSCGLTAQNTYPDNGSANDRNIARGAKFLIQQEDQNKPDGSQHETGVWHAEYGAIIENSTGVAVSNYASEPADAEKDGNCGGNGECWWLGNDYNDLTDVFNQQFSENLEESFTDAARVY